MISFYMRALYCFIVRHAGAKTAQHPRHSTSRYVTTRTTCRACRVVT